MYIYIYRYVGKYINTPGTRLIAKEVRRVRALGAAPALKLKHLYTSDW